MSSDRGKRPPTAVRANRVDVCSTKKYFETIPAAGASTHPKTLQQQTRTMYAVLPSKETTAMDDDTYKRSPGPTSDRCLHGITSCTGVGGSNNTTTRALRASRDRTGGEYRFVTGMLAHDDCHSIVVPLNITNHFKISFVRHPSPTTCARVHMLIFRRLRQQLTEEEEMSGR